MKMQHAKASGKEADRAAARRPFKTVSAMSKKKEREPNKDLLL